MANVSRAAGLSRRRFLARGLGAGAATFFAPQILAACGGGGGGGSATDLTGINLVKRFPGDILVPGRLRLPFSLATSSGVLTADSTTSIPDVLSFVVTDIDGNSIGLEDPLIVPSHVTDVPQPYWPLEVTIDKAGLYLVSIVGSDQPGASIQLVERSEVGVPLVGDPLPAIDTPTTDDPRDVDPICTREPACPLHDITLREALSLGKPVAYLRHPRVLPDRNLFSGTRCDPGGPREGRRQGDLRPRRDLHRSHGNDTRKGRDELQHDVRTGVVRHRCKRCVDRPPRCDLRCERSAGGVRPQRNQLKLLPQPQVRVALGLLIAKPASCRPSL